MLLICETLYLRPPLAQRGGRRQFSREQTKEGGKYEPFRIQARLRSNAAQSKDASISALQRKKSVVGIGLFLRGILRVFP
jgi:hypothetical protein